MNSAAALASAGLPVLPATRELWVGLLSRLPQASVFRERGYVTERGAMASDCAIYPHGTTAGRPTTPVRVIEHIESFRGPLLRYWRWSEGAKSALSISGDLDALSLLDYAIWPFLR